MPSPNSQLKNNQKSKGNLSNWLDILAMAGWGVLLIKLWLSDQLYLLIHPNYRNLTIITGFLLILFAAILAWQIKRKSFNFLPHQSFLPRWSSGLLISTAILGLLINPRPFGGDTAFQRGVGDQINAVRSVQSFRANAKSEERSLVEWIRTLNVYPEPDAYQGQKVKVSGFVVHPPNLSEQFILVTRFVITCCAADVYPVSLPVKLASGTRTDFPRDRWFEIEGQMITETLDKRRQLTIAASKLTPIPEPKNPYET
jgi:uncharacterized repeat protein (TIGR03943 family)